MPALLLFEGRMQPTYDSAELGRLWTELYEYATSEAAFGCIGHAGYSGAYGTNVGVYTFRDLAGLTAFRDDARHLAVRRRAGEFFAELSITVCTVERSYAVSFDQVPASA